MGFQQITNHLCSKTFLDLSKWKMMCCQGSDEVDIYDCLFAHFNAPELLLCARVH